MGQRSQVVVMTPKDGNSGGIYVFHNQWLYGEGLIMHLAKWIRALEYRFGDEFSFKSDRYIENCMFYANVLGEHPSNVTNTRWNGDGQDNSEYTEDLSN